MTHVHGTRKYSYTFYTVKPNHFLGPKEGTIHCIAPLDAGVSECHVARAWARLLLAGKKNEQLSDVDEPMESGNCYLWVTFGLVAQLPSY